MGRGSFKHSQCRRRKAEAVVRAIEGDQLTLSGMQEGGYDLPALKDPRIGTAFNVQTAIDSSNRILVSEIITF